MYSETEEEVLVLIAWIWLQGIYLILHFTARKIDSNNLSYELEFPNLTILLFPLSHLLFVCPSPGIFDVLHKF